MLEFLAQAGQSGFPQPGVFEKYVLDLGLWTGIVAIGIGLGAGYVVASRGENKKGAIAAVVGLVFGGAVIGLSFIETDRELIERRSMELVEAFFEGRGERVEELLSDRLVVSVGGERAGQTKRSVVSRAATSFGGGSSDWGGGVRDSGMDGPSVGRVRVGVRASGIGGFAVADLTWAEEEAGVWRAVSADIVSYNGNDARGLRF